MVKLEVHELVDELAHVAPEVSETVPAASGATPLSTDIGSDKTGSLQPNNAEVLVKLSTLVDQDNRVEKVDLAWNGKAGRLSVQGPVTRLVVILLAVMSPLGLVVFKGQPVPDAYFPMAVIAVVALAGSYLEKKK